MKTRLLPRALTSATALLAASGAFRVPDVTASESHSEEEEARLEELIGLLSAQDSKLCKDAAELLKIQSSKGNWDADPYMHGLLNGMILFGFMYAEDRGLVRVGDAAECPFFSAPKDGFPKE